MKKLVYALVALVLIVEIAVIVSGRSLLVWQHTVRPGEKYILEDYGDIGKAGGKSLACYYFTGMSVVGTAFHFSANNIFGRNRCPFFNDSAQE
jgi:hypothetical protein